MMNLKRRLIRFCFLLIALTITTLIEGVSTGLEEGAAPRTEARGGKDKLLIFTVGTDADHDGLRRLRQSAEHYGLRLHVFGTDTKWLGYDTKLKVIQRVLTADYVAQQGGGATVLLFVDAYDVLVDAGEEELLRRFKEHFVSQGSRIVFGAEQYCLQDNTEEYCKRFPPAKTSQRYLNSGLYMGYAEDLLRLWDEFLPTMLEDDDQVFYLRLYTDEAIKARYKIALDHHSLLFHNFPCVQSNELDTPLEISLPLRFDEATGTPYVSNLETGTRAVLIHGFGKNPYFYTLANYLSGRYNLRTGCSYCDIGEELAQTPSGELPLVGLALIMANNGGSETVGDFLQLASRLDYPPERIALFVINIRQGDKEAVAEFIEAAKSDGRYSSMKVWNADNEKIMSLSERALKIAPLNWAEKSKFDYVFMLDDMAQVENPSTLKRLVLMAAKYQLLVNFLY